MSIPLLDNDMKPIDGQRITVLIGDPKTGKTTWSVEYSEEKLTTYVLELDDDTESYVYRILGFGGNTVTVEMQSGQKIPEWLMDYDPRILVFWSDYPNTVVLDAHKEDRWTLTK